MLALALLLFKLSTLFFLLLLTVAYLRWDFVEAAFRHALSFAISKKIGTRWSCDKITLRSGSIAFENILIANGPGNWSAPFSVRMRRLRLTFRLVGFFSLWAPLTCGQNRVGSLDFDFGFRVKELETADFEDVEVYLEEAEEADAPPNSSATVIKKGVLRKAPRTGLGATKRRLVVLTPDRLSWYDEGKDPTAASSSSSRNDGSGSNSSSIQPRGVLKLRASSSVSAADDDCESPGTPNEQMVNNAAAANKLLAAASPPFSSSTAAAGGDGGEAMANPYLALSGGAAAASQTRKWQLMVVSGKKLVTLSTESKEERDEWLSALEATLKALKEKARSGGGAGAAGGGGEAWASNSEWIERILSEVDSAKTRRLLKAERRRREWKRRWQREGTNESDGGENTAAAQACKEPLTCEGRPEVGEDDVAYLDMDHGNAAVLEEEEMGDHRHHGKAGGGAEEMAEEGDDDDEEEEEGTMSALDHFGDDAAGGGGEEESSPRDRHELRSTLFANRNLPGGELLERLKTWSEAHVQPLLADVQEGTKRVEKRMESMAQQGVLHRNSHLTPHTHLTSHHHHLLLRSHLTITTSSSFSTHTSLLS